MEKLRLSSWSDKTLAKPVKNILFICSVELLFLIHVLLVLKYLFVLYSNSESGTVGVHLIVHILFLQMSDQGSGDIRIRRGLGRRSRGGHSPSGLYPPNDLTPSVPSQALYRETSPPYFMHTPSTDSSQFQPSPNLSIPPALTSSSSQDVPETQLQDKRVPIRPNGKFT